MSLRRLIVSSFIQKSRVTSYFVSITVREQRQRYDKNNEDPGYYKIGGGVMLGSVLYGASSVSGNLHCDDIVDHSDDELWAKEPFRDKRLIIKTAKPFNAEIPPQCQIEHFDTPNELFYVRQHLPVPDVNPATHKLRVTRVGRSVVSGAVCREFTLEQLSKFRKGRIRAALMCAGNRRSEMSKVIYGSPSWAGRWSAAPSAASNLRVTLVGRSVVSGAVCREFTLEQLSKFRKGRVRAALMCAGNRRSEMSKEVTDKDVKGISWAGGAISSAVWSGVYLRDVLLHCGVDEADVEGKHVIFQGADIDATGTNFNTSIPLSMALNPRGDILLATHMNGKPLPPDHGYPLRVVVPGAPAVRSVKWLESITVSDEESSSHWHKKDYRSFNSSKTWETADFESAPPVYSLPVTSAICEPEDCACATVSDGHITARGEGDHTSTLDGGLRERAARLQPAGDVRHLRAGGLRLRHRQRRTHHG
ncbi:Sulfite reductase [Operophtera brumata]|uniref:Sulfite reductase n=1 Tax=Operophtera brumata TaxID=104452 RepID=A0A0L7L5V9_OPEBR|nr:Sulfite reductase [Operophtera brumata]